MGLAYTGADKTEIDAKINQGIIDILVRTGCHVEATTLTEASGTGDYTLDASIIRVVGWTWQSATASIAGLPERVSPQELLRLRAFSTTNDTSAYPASAYALAGSDLLMVWPTPASADVITIYSVPFPTALSGSTDDPSDAANGGIPAEWHYGIELYGLWKMGDSSDDGTSAQGERYRLEYEGDPSAPVGSARRLGFIGRMKAELHRKGGRQRAQFPRGRRAQAFVFNDQRF